MQTKSMQLWPAGTCVEVRDDGDERSVRFAGEREYRTATPEEARAIWVEERAERILEEDVYALDSCLVDDLIRAASSGELSGDLADAFGYENCVNLRPDPSGWSLAECKGWLDENGHGRPDPDPWEMTRDELFGLLEANELLDAEDAAIMAEAGADGLLARVIEEIDSERLAGLDDWREAVTDNADGAEVYEWRRVSPWLADQLEGVGEVVLKNHYGEWWGRQGTGQAVKMDGVIQKIAARFVPG